jgi:hypothetical protein
MAKSRFTKLIIYVETHFLDFNLLSFSKTSISIFFGILLKVELIIEKGEWKRFLK